jgi:hypothetical protein
MLAREFRWALQLTGADIDIEDAIAAFGVGSDPEVHRLDDRGNRLTLLTSPRLDGLDDVREVDQVAKRLLALVNGVLFVLDANREPLTSGGFRERNANGRWNHHPVAEGLTIGRGRLRGIGVAILNGVAAPATPPPGLKWAAAAQCDDTVGDVLEYLSGPPDWFNFNKAYELMRDDINKKLGQHKQEAMGWPKKRVLDCFTCSAQVYRHSSVNWPTGYNYTTAMPLKEATAFLHGLTNKWLAWRFP